jgi:hypothetical protein
VIENVIENVILIPNGDVNDGGDGDGGGRRTRLIDCSLAVPSVSVTGPKPAAPVIAAGTDVARIDIEVGGTTVLVGPVEVVSEAYIVAVAAEGMRMAVAMWGTEEHKVSSVSKPASLEGAESFGSTLAPPLCPSCCLHEDKWVYRQQKKKKWIL